MTIEELGEIIAKGGTLLIAVAVFVNTWAQTRWSNDVTLRAAAVEDQKFRLALLDRRVEAVAHLQTAFSSFWTEGSFRPTAMEAIGKAMAVANLVFEDAERDAIERLLKLAWDWEGAERQIRLNAKRSSFDMEKRYQAAIDRQGFAEAELFDGFGPLLLRLTEATRVRSIPPLIARRPAKPRLRP